MPPKMSSELQQTQSLSILPANLPIHTSSKQTPKHPFSRRCQPEAARIPGKQGRSGQDSARPQQVKSQSCTGSLPRTGALGCSQPLLSHTDAAPAAAHGAGPAPGDASVPCPAGSSPALPDGSFVQERLGGGRAARVAGSGCRLSRSGLRHRGETFRPSLPPKPAFHADKRCLPSTKPKFSAESTWQRPLEIFLRLVWLRKMTLGTRKAPEEAADGSWGRINPPSLRLRVPPGWRSRGWSCWAAPRGWEKPAAALERLRHAGDRRDIGVPPLPGSRY